MPVSLLLIHGDLGWVGRYGFVVELCPFIRTFGIAEGVSWFRDEFLDGIEVVRGAGGTGEGSWARSSVVEGRRAKIAGRRVGDEDVFPFDLAVATEKNKTY